MVTKAKKKILTSSVMMLLVSTLALSSATFAWFTNGTSGTVSQMRFKAASADGIQISVDAVEFKTTLDSSDFKGITNSSDAYDTNYYSTTLTPVSSVGATNSNGELELFAGEIENAALETTASAEGASGAFWKLNIYVKNDGAEKTLYLNMDPTATTVSGYTLAADSSSDSKNVIAGEADVDSGIQNAVRFAFLDQGPGTESTQTAGSVIAAKGAASDTSLAKVKIFEPNDSVHTDYAQTYRYVVDSTTGLTTSALVGTAHATSPLKYVGIKAATGEITDQNPGITLAKGAAAEYDNGSKTSIIDASKYNSTSSKGLAIATLGEQQITKVTIYVWLEGQDVDCNNYESGGSVQFTLEFTTTNPDA